MARSLSRSVLACDWSPITSSLQSPASPTQGTSTAWSPFKFNASSPLNGLVHVPFSLADRFCSIHAGCILWSPLTNVTCSMMFVLVAVPISYRSPSFPTLILHWISPLLSTKLWHLSTILHCFRSPASKSWDTFDDCSTFWLQSPHGPTGVFTLFSNCSCLDSVRCGIRPSSPQCLNAVCDVITGV